MLARLERRYGLKQGQLSNQKLQDISDEIDAVNAEIGLPGSGVYLENGGPNANTDVNASAAINQKKGNMTMTVWDSYFDRKAPSKTIVHEMGHAVLGYRDSVDAGKVPQDGTHVLGTDDPSVNKAYGWAGVDAAAAQGIYINDGFACSMGYRC